MEYQVPQFIEVEDKIFGPFTLKQFIFLAGGTGLCVFLILYLPLFLGILLSLPVAALAAALAFYKINNKPFIEVLEAGFTYYIGSRLYLWKKDKGAQPTAPAAPEVSPATPQKLGLSQRRLEELAWSLDVRNTGNTPEA